MGPLNPKNLPTPAANLDTTTDSETHVDGLCDSVVVMLVQCVTYKSSRCMFVDQRKWLPERSFVVLTAGESFHNHVLPYLFTPKIKKYVL